ncbi:MAG: kelch repeat-containing protein [Chitinophagales bacterium]
MKKILYCLLLFLPCMLSTNTTRSQTNALTWTRIAELPADSGTDKQFGLAGAFTGVSGRVLIIAGGANFSGGMPWQGGKKIYHDALYVLQKDKNSRYIWLHPRNRHLKNKLAYGASVSMPAGIVCIGGESETGFSNGVFLIRWDDIQKNVVLKSLPSLPVALANACATAMGNRIYVAGGENAEKALDNFFMFDLADPKPHWESLPPVPLAMSNSVAVTQSNGRFPCVYILGGRSKTSSGISDLHSTVFCYEPGTRRWRKSGGIRNGMKPVNLSAGTGFALGRNHIVLTGGDQGDIFHVLEKFNTDIAAAGSDREREILQNKKSAILNHHPGFSKAVLLYNTLTGAWENLPELPFPAQVTTTGVKWNDDLIIPSGEIKPGVRTPDVMLGKINLKIAE